MYALIYYFQKTLLKCAAKVARRTKEGICLQPTQCLIYHCSNATPTSISYILQQV